MKNWLRALLLAAKPAYGGQAVVNGVMMLGKRNYAVSVTTSKGLVTKTFPFRPLNQRNKFFGLPFVRGIVNLIDMFIIGYASLMYSAEIASEEDATQPTKWYETAILYGSIVLSILFAIFLFKFLPLTAASLADTWFSLSSTWFTIIDGVVKMGIFLAYVAIIGLYKDVKDLFRYHGGEHKTINCYEANLPLTIKNMSAQTTVHMRCGTTFVFVVLFMSILVYFFIPQDLPFVVNLGLRLALLPVIAALAYELQRFTAKSRSPFFKVLLKPGLWLQSLTVHTPAPRHLRAGRASLQAVLEKERKQQ